MKKDISKTLNNNTLYSEELQKSFFFNYIQKINQSFFYAEKVLIVSAVVMALGSLFFIFSHYYGYDFLPSISIFKTGLLTVNLFFLLFLGITMFALAHKISLDLHLWKQHAVKKPLAVSLLTLLIVVCSCFFSPIVACFMILICSLSVGLRVQSNNFIDLLTQITNKHIDKLAPNIEVSK